MWVRGENCHPMYGKYESACIPLIHAKADLKWIWLHGSPGGRDSLVRTIAYVLELADKRCIELEDRNVKCDETSLPINDVKEIMQEVCRYNDRTNNWHFKTKESMIEDVKLGIEKYLNEIRKEAGIPVMRSKVKKEFQN